MSTPLAIAGHFPELAPYPPASGLGAKVPDRRDPVTRARAIEEANKARGAARKRGWQGWREDSGHGG